MKTCYQCEKDFDYNYEGIMYDDEFYCDDCLDSHFEVCNKCGKYVHNDDVTYDYYDNAYCLDCADDLHECDYCGYSFICYDVILHNDECICDNCFNDYTICSDCKEIIPLEDANYENTYYGEEAFCNDCYNKRCSIHDYSYKPEPYFCGKGRRFLGIELEVDSGGCNHDNAREIMETLGNDFIYAKHDSSIDDGFELVSHPCTLDFHTKTINWENGLNELSSMGYESHDAETCGIHVHMNREQFGDTWGEQDLAIAKILYFIERHWDNVVKFSRRTNRQLSDWANRYLSKIDDEESYSPHEVLDYAKDDGSRYRAVNLCNHSTVEIRIFRGTLKYSSFMAILQFCDLLYDVAEMDLTEVISITWKDFIKMGSKYDEFTTYVTERNLV